jgi:hypothetical protein
MAGSRRSRLSIFSFRADFQSSNFYLSDASKLLTCMILAWEMLSLALAVVSQSTLTCMILA